MDSYWSLFSLSVVNPATAGLKEEKNVRESMLRPIQNLFATSSFEKASPFVKQTRRKRRSQIRAQEKRQFFIRTNDEALTASAKRVSGEDCSSVEIHG